MKKLISELIHDQTGATAIEYGLICALIVLAMLTALQNFASETQNTWNTVSTATHDAVAGATGA
jgi:pilus assembly protein Flp/PilA